MKINGIGIVSKKVAMGILTREGREAVKNGDITLEELGEMYKLNQPGSQPDSHKAKCQSVLKSLSTQSRNGIPAHANRQNGRQRYFWRNYRR